MLYLWLLPVAAAASSTVRPWSHFFSGWSGAAENTRRQRFAHTEHQRLRDGRGMHLSWEVHADPESILALDWEHQSSGIALTSCGQDYLILHVPQELAAQSAHWQFVTLSSRRHNCKHLAGRDLYHRVLGVAARKSAGSVEELKLHTEELGSASHLFPHYSFRVALTPPGPVVGRRLEQQQPVVLGDAVAPADNYNWTWNWSFKPPTPMRLNLSTGLPGLVLGHMALDVRTLEASLAVVLNYTSTKNELTGAPDEHFMGKVDLNVSVDADLRTALKFQEPHTSTGVPAVIDANVPVPPELKANFTFFLGPIPVTILPSVDAVRLKIVHSGVLKGSGATMLKTDLVMGGLTTFDTATGLNFSLNGTALDTKILPPSIMITDRDFKFDIAITTNVSMMPFFKASFTPRMNMSVMPVSSLPTLSPLPGVVTMPPAVAVAPPPTALPGMPTLPPLPPLDCTSHDIEVCAHAAFDFSASVPMLGKVFEESTPSEHMHGELGNLLPLFLCAAGYCQGKPPGCPERAVNEIRVKTIAVRMSRSICTEDVDESVRQAIAYGLALFPSEAKVVDGFMQNESSGEQIAVVEDALEKPLGEMADDLQEEIETAGRDGLHAAKEEVAMLMPPGLSGETSQEVAGADPAVEEVTTQEVAAAEPAVEEVTAEPAENRRLAAKRRGAMERDSFVIEVRTNRPITTALLQSLARDGAFRIRDGRESTHGEIRINSIGLHEPKPQQLWAQVPAGAKPAAPAAGKAPAAATSWGTAALAFAAFAALMLVGLSSVRFFSRRPRTYEPMPGL